MRTVWRAFASNPRACSVDRVSLRTSRSETAAAARQRVDHTFRRRADRRLVGYCCAAGDTGGTRRPQGPAGSRSTCRDELVLCERFFDHAQAIVAGSGNGALSPQ